MNDIKKHAFLEKKLKKNAISTILSIPEKKNNTI